MREFNPEWDDIPSISICPVCGHVSEGDPEMITTEDGEFHKECYESIEEEL